MLQRLRWFSAVDLASIAKAAAGWPFSAKLDITEVEAARRERFPVLAATDHIDRLGRDAKCEPHMRCLILLDDAPRSFDVPMNVFAVLPNDSFEVRVRPGGIWVSP